jgi:hypothetical protein
MSVDLEEEQDPPAFKAARRKDKEQKVGERFLPIHRLRVSYYSLFSINICILLAIHLVSSEHLISQPPEVSSKEFLDLQSEIEKLLTDQKKRSSAWETYVVGECAFVAKRH